MDAPQNDLLTGQDLGTSDSYFCRHGMPGPFGWRGLRIRVVSDLGSKQPVCPRLLEGLPALAPLSRARSPNRTRALPLGRSRVRQTDRCDPAMAYAERLSAACEASGPS